MLFIITILIASIVILGRGIPLQKKAPSRGALCEIMTLLSFCTGQYNETVFVGIDYLLAQAGQYSIKAVVSLMKCAVSWNYIILMPMSHLL